MGKIDENEEIDLLELTMFLVGRWKLILLALVIGGGIGAAIYIGTVQPIYKANAELYITNSDTVIDFQDVQLSAELTVDYEEILLSRKVLKKVIEDQNLGISYRDLKQRVSVTNPTDSHCLIISVTADTAEEAIHVTNSILKYGIDQIYRIVGENEPAVIDSAEADAVDEVQPSIVKYAALGILCGMVLICALFVMQYLMDTTLKSDEDVEKYMKLDVLAVVPERTHRRKKA